MEINKIKRICPWCNEEFTYLNKHINSVHNKCQQDYYMKINNLTEMPNCKLNGCNNKVKVIPSDMDKCREFCCGSHSNKYRINTWNSKGINPFSKSNMKVNELTGKYDLHEKAHEARLNNGSYTRNKIGDPNKTSTLYIGVFNKENIIKLGISKDLYKRMGCYKSGNIIFDSKIIFESTEDVIVKLEAELQEIFINNKAILDINKYHNPINTYMTLGHTEWYNIDILNEIKEKLSELISPLKFKEE